MLFMMRSPSMVYPGLNCAGRLVQRESIVGLAHQYFRALSHIA
jgi:hypothetical protein